MSGTAQTAPDLDAKLDAILRNSRGNRATCSYCLLSRARPELTSLVDKRVATGQRAWAGYRRFFIAEGIDPQDLSVKQISTHYDREHNVER